VKGPIEWNWICKLYMWNPNSTVLFGNSVASVLLPRGMSINLGCMRCNTAIEDVHHFAWSCFKSRRYGNWHQEGLGETLLRRWVTVISGRWCVVQRRGRGFVGVKNKAVIACTLWRLWKSRNELIFSKEKSCTEVSRITYWKAVERKIDSKARTVKTVIYFRWIPLNSDEI